MADFSAWLESLGLKKYEKLFAEHEIDFDVLSELTEDDFEKLGIRVGSRKKLLNAISSFEKDVGKPTQSPANSLVSELERRHLTIMFCDLVDSTALSEQLDPEDLRETIHIYRESCKPVIEYFQGYVTSYSGDGILAYFGFPQAHEDDAERALRAGLGIINLVPTLQAQPNVSLQVRIGVASGLVVTGQTSDGDEELGQSAVGQTPNLAARLQRLAQVNTMFVSEETRKLAGGGFRYEDAGQHSLKGFSAPVQVWRVSEDRLIDSRFAALHKSDLTPLVGRKQEIDLLLDHWSSVKQGNTPALLLVGDPGIGKSRLVAELCRRIEDGLHALLRYQCSPYHIDSALFPVVDQIARMAAIDTSDSHQTKLEKLTALLEESRISPEAVTPLLALFLPTPTGDHHSLPEMTPERHREITLAAVVDLMMSRVEQQPTLFVFEDTHWVDPTSLELIDMLIMRSRETQALILLTSRPDASDRWAKNPLVRSITLGRLMPSDVSDLIQNLTGGRTLPHEVFEQIVNKTDGVALFVEELTKTILESKLLRKANRRYELAGPLPPFVIPSTLHDSLMERLDKMGSAKRVAQIGACIGREFPFDLLMAVADLSERELMDGLAQLTASNLIHSPGALPTLTYVFKHALVQETAHASLLRTRRRELHARIARQLETSLEARQAHLESLARHFREADLLEEAVSYYLLAAQRATELSANMEALRWLDEALNLLTKQPDTPTRSRAELSVQLSRGKALRALKGTGAKDTQAAYRLARDVCEKFDERTLLKELYDDYVHTLAGESASAFDGAELKNSRRAARELVRLGETRSDISTLIIGHQAIGLCSFSLGEFRDAQEHLEYALEYGNQSSHSKEITDTQFPGPALTYLSWTLFIRGLPSRARDLCSEAISVAEQGSPVIQALAYCNACYLYQFLHDATAVRRHSRRLIQIASENDMYSWRNMGDYFQGWALTQTEDIENGITLMQEIVECRDIGKIEMPYLIGLLAQAQGKVGDISPALSLVEAALQLISDTNESWFEAEVHRIKGELLLLRPATSQHYQDAQTCFQRSLAIAREQHASMWELRTTLSLVRLWQEQNRIDDSRELFAPMYRSFAGQSVPELHDMQKIAGWLQI